MAHARLGSYEAIWSTMYLMSDTKSRSVSVDLIDTVVYAIEIVGGHSLRAMPCGIIGEVGISY